LPFVPDPDNPNLSYFKTCPFYVTVQQYVIGYDVGQIVGAEKKKEDYQMAEWVQPVVNAPPEWKLTTQILEFEVGDDPLVRIKPPTPLTQIAALEKVGIANVYMIVGCEGCIYTQTLGKGKWDLEMSVYPSTGNPNPTGLFLPKDGTASTEQPHYP